VGQYALQVLCPIIATASASVKHGVHQSSLLAAHRSFCMFWHMHDRQTTGFGLVACACERLRSRIAHNPLLRRECPNSHVSCRLSCKFLERHGLRPLGRSRQQGRDGSSVRVVIVRLLKARVLEVTATLSLLVLGAACRVVDRMAVLDIALPGALRPARRAKQNAPKDVVATAAPLPTSTSQTQSRRRTPDAMESTTKDRRWR
jgi:hypothetical protein